MSKSKSFSRNLSNRVLLLTSLLFVVVITVTAVSSHLIIANEAKKSTEHLVSATMKDIEKDLQRVEFSVEASSWLVGENRDDDEYLYHITQMIVTENDDIVGSAIAFADGESKGRHFFSPYSYIDPDSGKTVSKQLGNKDYDYFGMEWFEHPYSTGEPCWSEPYFDLGGGGYMMSTYSFPIRDSNGVIYAIITADMTLDGIDRIMDDIRPYKESFSIILSRRGTCLGNSGTQEYIGLPLDSVLRRDRIVGKSMNGEIASSGTARYFIGSKLYFAVYDTLDNGWVLAVSCKYADVLARASKLHLILILIGILGILALYFICLRAVGRMTRPLLDFCSATKDIASGDFNVTLPEIHSEDEILQLHDSFRQMQESLKQYMNDLKDSTARNERMQSELAIASAIQQAMLSRDFPKDGNVDIYADLKSAKEVGGDLYDFFIKDGCLYFAIGDVSGKGVPAAMFMAITKAAFRFIAGMGLPMDEVMCKLNDSISNGNTYNMFVTMFIGKIDLSSGEMTYCNAGHNPLLKDGKFLPVVPNIVVGALPGFKFVRQSTTLGKGSRLVLYTDGITEAENAGQLQFGDDRLTEWAGGAQGSAEEACNDLLARVHEFVGDNPQSDDMTVMIIDIK